MNTIIGGLVAIALIAAVVILTWHGNIDGQAAIAFFSGTFFAGIVGGVQHVATKTGARAANSQF